MSVRNELEWLFGDLFTRRIEFEASYRESAPSQMIQTIQKNMATADSWSAFIRNYRNALLNEDVPPQSTTVSQSLPEA